jgi:hypothetical protein
MFKTIELLFLERITIMFITKQRKKLMKEKISYVWFNPLAWSKLSKSCYRLVVSNFSGWGSQNQNVGLLLTLNRTQANQHTPMNFACIEHSASKVTCKFIVW